MSRKQGTLKLSSNIEPLAASPLDARLVVPTLADLTASGAFPYPYVGMIVSVQSEGKAYMLTADNPTVLANWKEIGGGGSDYTAGYGVAIDNGIISTRTFVGTKAQWNALSSSQQSEYTYVNITDDNGPSDELGLSVVNGTICVTYNDSNS